MLRITTEDASADAVQGFELLASLEKRHVILAAVADGGRAWSLSSREKFDAVHTYPP